MKKEYLDYAVGQLKNVLAIPSPSGFTAKVGDYLMAELTSLGYRPQRTVKGGVRVDLGGENPQDGLVLSCHVDTLGAMVSLVKESGRLRVTPVGGLDANNIETENATVFTRDGRSYSGTFQLENASVHTNKEYALIRRTFETVELVLDEKVSTAEGVKELGIDVGDFVCLDPRTTITETGYIKSRFLDDKLSSSILLAYAKYLKDENVTPKRRIYLHFTVYEEIGHGASASVPEGVTEILAVDMGCVGKDLRCDETMVSICAGDSNGPSSYEVVNALVETAKANNINYALDIYPQYGSDADAALRAGYDVRHCVVGAGVYASHGYERSHLEGLSNTFNLLNAYIPSSKN